MLWVVCEHAETGSILLRLIKAKGYEVEVLDCGQELRKRAQFQTPDLIIVDCGVPESFLMIREIRSRRHARSPAVIMFSRDEQNMLEQALAHGADSYVPKGSLDWAELLAEIEKFARPAH